MTIAERPTQRRPPARTAALHRPAVPTALSLQHGYNPFSGDKSLVFVVSYRGRRHTVEAVYSDAAGDMGVLIDDTPLYAVEDAALTRTLLDALCAALLLRAAHGSDIRWEGHRRRVAAYYGAYCDAAANEAGL